MPERVIRILHASFRRTVLDVKGMSRATWKLLGKLMDDRVHDGCAPYWVVTRELGLPICKLYSILFDAILGQIPVTFVNLGLNLNSCL